MTQQEAMKNVENALDRLSRSSDGGGGGNGGWFQETLLSILPLVIDEAVDVYASPLRMATFHNVEISNCLIRIKKSLPADLDLTNKIDRFIHMEKPPNVAKRQKLSETIACYFPKKRRQMTTTKEAVTPEKLKKFRNRLSPDLICTEQIDFDDERAGDATDFGHSEALIDFLQEMLKDEEVNQPTVTKVAKVATPFAVKRSPTPLPFTLHEEMGTTRHFFPIGDDKVDLFCYERAADAFSKVRFAAAAHPVRASIMGLMSAV